MIVSPCELNDDCTAGSTADHRHCFPNRSLEIVSKHIEILDVDDIGSNLLDVMPTTGEIALPIHLCAQVQGRSVESVERVQSEHECFKNPGNSLQLPVILWFGQQRDEVGQWLDDYFFRLNCS